MKVATTWTNKSTFTAAHVKINIRYDQNTGLLYRNVTVNSQLLRMFYLLQLGSNLFSWLCFYMWITNYVNMFKLFQNILSVICGFHAISHKNALSWIPGSKVWQCYIWFHVITDCGIMEPDCIDIIFVLSRSH